ncbi:MAG: 50S ribosomal protein L22 [Candidatus Altiarchaeota archaeon]|nr:50S ribosomal protein L22 [Candidatus Altiarchaeota archaeon]
MEAKARLSNVHMSPKYSREMALAIKGKNILRARKILEDVVTLERPIELKRHNKEVPHKYGKPARYPVKVAKNFLELLHSAIENAKYKGADEAKLIVDNVLVTRGYHKRVMGSKALGKAKVRGRRANVLMVLKEEVKEVKGKSQKVGKSSKAGKSREIPSGGKVVKKAVEKKTKVPKKKAVEKKKTEKKEVKK